MGFLPLHSDKTIVIDDINVFKDYDGPSEDKIVFCRTIMSDINISVQYNLRYKILILDDLFFYI